MKRKLLSLVLASFLTMSVPLCAFAASGFDLSVFKGQDDIKVVYDDMADDADISVPSLLVYGAMAIIQRMTAMYMFIRRSLVIKIAMHTAL